VTAWQICTIALEEPATSSYRSELYMTCLLHTERCYVPEDCKLNF